MNFLTCRQTESNASQHRKCVRQRKKQQKGKQIISGNNKHSTETNHRVLYIQYSVYTTLYFGIQIYQLFE